MTIPSYNKKDLDAVPMTGEYELVEFDQYIKELKSSDWLSHSAAIGVVSLVADQGTAGLSSSQLNVLQIAVNQFPMEHCIRCGEVIVIQAGAEPGFCENCQDFIRAQ